MRNLNSIIIIILLINNHSCTLAQKKDERIISMIKTFYSTYINEVASNRSIMELTEKLDSLQKIYCTDKLLNTIPDIMEETDADVFLKAQDVNVESINTLIVKKDLRNHNKYIVSYYDPYSKNSIIIILRVVKDKGKYKIDSVQ